MIDIGWADIGWVDIAMCAFLALSVIVGLTRGVVFELLSLTGWFAAYFAARWFAPFVLPYIQVGTPGSNLNQGLALVSVFIAALVTWSLVARLVRLLIRATPLSALDRLIGSVFGLLRGMLVLMVVVLIVGVTPAAKSAAWHRSQGAVWLNAAVQEVKPWLPFQVIQIP